MPLILYLELNSNIVLKNQFVISNDLNGLCYIDLPINSNQAATYFEWKLRIVKKGFKEINNYHQPYKIENEIKVGISNLKHDILLSTKSGNLFGDGMSMQLNVKKTDVNVKEADILLFQFDCKTGTLFFQKNDQRRILLAYINDLGELQKDTFYPCVRFERGGDTIEILSAGPIHNSIHSTPTTVSRSYWNIISSIYLFINKHEIVLVLIISVCFAYYVCFSY